MQRTREWQLMRAGHITGTGIKKVMSSGRGGGDSKVREAYLRQIVAEIITGEPQDYAFENFAMQQGTENEPAAREFYRAKYPEQSLNEQDFITHPAIKNCGYSPDGLVGKDGLIEIKCPLPPQHLENIRLGKVPTEYLPQIQWGLACSDREWCDFVSFAPGVPEKYRGLILRVDRDNDMIEDMESSAKKFLETVHERITEILATESS